MAICRYWLMVFILIFGLSATVKVFGEDIASYNNKGNECYDKSDFRCALFYWEKGLAAAGKMNHKQGMGAFLSNIGIVYTDLGNYPEALKQYEQALAIYREIGDKKGVGNDLTNIGVVYTILGNYPEALKHYEQALAIAREIGDKKGEGVIFQTSALSIVI